MRIGGNYLGIVDAFEREAELDPEAGAVCEMQPLGPYLPLCFRFDEELLVRPPRGITLVYAEDALCLYAAHFLPADQTLRVLWQRRLGDTLLTLTRQGELLLWLDRGSEMRLCPLPEQLCTCTPVLLREGILLEGEEYFLLLSAAGDVLWQGEGRVLSHAPLHAELFFRDCLGQRAECEWREGGAHVLSFRRQREPTEETMALALAESAKIGADCAPFLAPALRDKADVLREYLGEFAFAAPTDAADRIALGYPRFEGIYDLRYLRVTFEGGLIANLVRE